MLAGAHLHIATDHLEYFRAIADLLQKDSRFAEAPVFEPAPEERTDFEVLFLAKSAAIGRASFRKL